MKRKTWCAFLSLAACVALVGDVIAGPISVGNLVVVQSGDGSAALSSASTAGFLKEFTTAGTPVQSISLPTAASGSNAPLTLTGNATSEGFISQSSNGPYLVLGGYAAAPGVAAIPTTSTTTGNYVNRVVGRVTISSGAIDTTTSLTDGFDGSNIRSAYTTNGTDIWAAGNAGSGLGTTGGVKYTTLGSSTSTRVNTGTGSGSNSRVVEVFGGQLYVSASSSPRLAVQQIGTGTPMVAGATETTLTGMPTSGTHSAYDYWFKDANTIYLADDGSATSGGGIQKWTLSAGTWTLAYTLLNNGTATTGVRGLTGTIGLGGDAILFATTTQASANNLITVTDTGAGATATTLATAPTNTAFRGVEYINVPEPASLTLIGLSAVGLAGLARRRR